MVQDYGSNQNDQRQRKGTITGLDSPTTETETIEPRRIKSENQISVEYENLVRCIGETVESIEVVEKHYKNREKTLGLLLYVERKQERLSKSSKYIHIKTNTKRDFNAKLNFKECHAETSITLWQWNKKRQRRNFAQATCYKLGAKNVNVPG